MTATRVVSPGGTLVAFYESDGDAHDMSHYVIFPEVEYGTPGYRLDFPNKAQCLVLLKAVASVFDQVRP